ncbi:hypothetical protein HGI30_21810 [Paenibacillus albicereus]|uniref:Uncharacterized protein n=1 Tax=Paenibacillus albicereus TaxID=2726185 RepID=A0A6H2H2J2_9BACL|nr:hypothetical protein [Paenibacillus albicereus]QJC53900.1 hypothetical protein HGI30_21810 [Paenibacillus albicereus]
MKQAWRITAADRSRIGRSWSACPIIAGLALLPSLYGWFNILTSSAPMAMWTGCTLPSSTSLIH